MKLFLSHAGLGEVRGGVELYAGLLKKTFPDLEALDYHSLKQELGDTFFSPLREPIRAKRLGEYVSKNYSQEAAVFSNGMFSWNLKHRKQINICHGTYAAMADSSIPKTNIDHYRLKYIYSKFEEKAAKNSSAVVANSRQTQRAVKKYFGTDSKIIYPPVDLDNFRSVNQEKAKNGLGWTGVNILFVGRPENTKGFDFVEGLASKNPEMGFKCILSRPYKPRLANMEAIEPKKHADLPLYYSASDLVLFPSRFEGYGFVTVEALSCNKKVICLNTGIASEIDSQNLFIAKPSLRDLHEKIMVALNSEPSNSRPLIKQGFSFARFEKEWLELAQTI